jgi:hypothetical protein
VLLGEGSDDVGCPERGPELVVGEDPDGCDLGSVEAADVDGSVDGVGDALDEGVVVGAAVVPGRSGGGCDRLGVVFGGCVHVPS